MARGQSSSGNIFSRAIDVRVAALAIVVAIAAFAGLYMLLTREPVAEPVPLDPAEVTQNAMYSSIEGIAQHMRDTSGKVPQSIAELPLTPAGKPQSPKDGWGTDFFLKITGGGTRWTIEIRSAGPDATRGNADDLVLDGTVERDSSGLYYVSNASTR